MKTNSKSFPWRYVEIMACPSGCIGGGGQLPVQTSIEVGPDGDSSSAASSTFRANRQLASEIKKVFNEQNDNVKQWAWNEPFGMALYNHLKKTDCHSVFTSYRAVEKTVTSVLKW